MFYSDDIIEEVRQRNDIVDVIGGYVRLQKKGSNYFGLCPFHNEKSPSFSVSAGKQIYYCFGCGAGGNVISFLMQYENATFVEAMKELAERAGVTLPEQEYSAEAKRQSDARSVLLEIQKVAAKYFFYQMKSEKGQIGYAYFKNRGLKDETIKSFGLGFANPYSNDLYQYLKARKYTDEQLKDSGLCYIDERGGRDKFWNRVMFPIMDVNNRVIGFGGRVLGEGEPKYLNSPETKIFDKSRNLYGLNIARRTRENYMLVCEGYMDVISLHQAGFTNAVAALGTAFTIQHGLLMKRYTRDVVLTFDSDGAGIKAALRAIPILKEAGLNIKVLNMKPYKDPDEFIKAEGAEAYRERIHQAMNGFLFQIKVLREDYDFSDPSQKTEFFEETGKRLLSFSDQMERNNYIEAVSREYGMDYSVMKSKVESLAGSGYIPKEYAGDDPEGNVPKAKARTRSKEKDDGVKRAQRLLLTWLSEEPERYPRIADIIAPEDFTEGLYLEVAKLLFEQLEKQSVNPGEIMNHFLQEEEAYPEVAKIFNTRLAAHMNKEEAERAFRDCVIRIRKNSLEAASQRAESVAQLQEILTAQKALQNLDF